MDIAFIIVAVVLLLFVVVVLLKSIYIVPQKQVMIVERLGRFHKKAEAGLHIQDCIFWCLFLIRYAPASTCVNRSRRSSHNPPLPKTT